MSTTDSGETERCGCCGKHHAIEEVQTICDDDGPWCLACVAEWEAAFAACEHAWQPADGIWGPSQYCPNCGGIMEDLDFAARFPAEAERLAQQSVEGRNGA